MKIISSMTKISAPAKCWGLAVIACLPGTGAFGQANLEVSWGSALVEQKMILQDGSGMDSGPLIAEMGSFGSFVPTENNMDQWLTNWKVFDAITNPDADPNGSDFLLTNTGDSRMAKFAGSAHLITNQYSDSEDAALQNPGATFGGLEQGYVFFRTGDALNASNQWLLFTSAIDGDGLGLADSVWQFPTLSGSQTQFPLAWWLDQADTAIVGAINGGSGGGGSTGGGGYSDGSTDFALRLHSVPEPGVPLLLTLLGVLLVRRQR